METEGSLPCSEEPATGSYFELDGTNPVYTYISFIFILILSFHLRLGLPSVLLLSLYDA
jgi:hypothetical protein